VTTNKKANEIMSANATERELQFTTVLEVASQARAEFNRQRGWDKIPKKVTRYNKFTGLPETETCTLYYDMSDSAISNF
jgi:hypothetical protein